MNEPLNIDQMKYIIESIIEYGYESVEREKKKPTSFNSGRSLAYWEVLDTIYSRLEIYDQNPKDFGYPEDWEKPFLRNEEL